MEQRVHVVSRHEFDLHYVEGIDALHDAEFELVVDDQPTTLRFSRGHLDQAAGEPADPILTVHTSSSPPRPCRRFSRLGD